MEYAHPITPPSYRPADKVAKESVEYGHSTQLPNGARCLICINYRAGPQAGRPDFAHCRRVQGAVWATAWCRLFEERANAAQTGHKS